MLCFAFLNLKVNMILSFLRSFPQDLSLCLLVALGKFLTTMINWLIKHISLAHAMRHLVSPGIMLICSEAEPVLHRWDLTAVCKFPEERGNKVHKQPAASANLQDYGVETQVHKTLHPGVTCRVPNQG